jgi:hypothetical protein
MSTIADSVNVLLGSMNPVARETVSGGQGVAVSRRGTNAYTQAAVNVNGVDSLKLSVDSAVASALGKLDKSASAEEIMMTIRTTINSTLQESGVDPVGFSGGRVADLDTTLSKGETAAEPTTDGGVEVLKSKIESFVKEAGLDVERFTRELASASAIPAGSATMMALQVLASSKGINTQA